MANPKTALLIALLSGSMLAAPASAGGASTDRIDDIETVLAVRFEDDFPLRSLMRADCAFVQRVERPDGSSRETMTCDLSDRPVMIPDFQGAPPDRAVRYTGGACMWASDYWTYAAGTAVYADRFTVVVTPSGKVHAESTYRAEPLICE